MHTLDLDWAEEQLAAMPEPGCGLTNAQLVTMARAAVLIGSHARALSDFELETVSSLTERFLREGRLVATTPAEWSVFEAAVEAMSAAGRGHPARRTAA